MLAALLYRKLVNMNFELTLLMRTPHPHVIFRGLHVSPSMQVRQLAGHFLEGPVLSAKAASRRLPWGPNRSIFRK